MRLRDDLPPTPFKFKRGESEDAIPFTGDANQPQAAVWWTKKQVLEANGLAYAPGKIFLGRVDDRMIGLRDNRHVVTVAGSRGGKSASLLIPNLKLYPESALVIDPKGELARETAEYRSRVLGHDVHVLDPWNVTGLPNELRRTFDPIGELLADRANLIDNADLIADALIIPSGGDQHWSDAARALLRSLILWLALSPGEGLTLSYLPQLLAGLASEKTKSEGGRDSLLDQLAEMDITESDPDTREAMAIIRSQAAMMLGTADRERSSIYSSARTQLAFLESPALAANLQPSPLRLRDLKRRRTTIYLCMPATRMSTHNRWLRMIVNLAVAALEDAPTRKDDSGEDVDPVLFVLEEFAALGHMEALEKAVAYLGGFGVKLWAVLQDLTQLQRHYKDSWETFLANAGVLQAFSVSDLTTCKYLSERMGETTFQITNKVDVNADQSLKGDIGLRREFKTAPLLTPDELAIKFARVPDGKGGMKGGLALVLVAGTRPFIVDRVFHKELVE
ncbi:type IV secretory system conjugative DNA transfer family protein [Sphingomonas leidyi]|uniref:type IV secretory system conjugative DNA transfer family protein n=1 Tax=Sphingomonas leidyi TaxID=68569 RepID=UPI0036D2812C